MLVPVDGSKAFVYPDQPPTDPTMDELRIPKDCAGFAVPKFVLDLTTEAVQ
jgi:hypothetical protein